MDEYKHDFAMERRLKELDPELHKRFTDAVFCLQRILSNYQLIFPDYTDHTELHSLTVINFCNQLIGDGIGALNADEIYSLLMGCYFHDTGMGVTRKDYEEFSREMEFGDFFDANDPDDIKNTIRAYHHQYSWFFIRKYADLFELPSQEHLRAVAEIALGHRRTDLKDEAEYPVALKMPNGNTVCLPYLAALIRLADEIDVASDRNSPLLYGDKEVANILSFNMHRAVHGLEITEDAFTLAVDSSDAGIFEEIKKMAVKMQDTLDECRAAVIGRTPHSISQQKVLIREL